MYTLILKNNSTNEFTVYDGLQNVSGKQLYLEFNDVELEVPDGEYTYAVFSNDRDDITYDFKAEILDTVLHTEDGDVELRDINPRIGLLRIGLVEETNKYDNNSRDTYYYEG